MQDNHEKTEPVGADQNDQSSSSPDDANPNIKASDASADAQNAATPNSINPAVHSTEQPDNEQPGNPDNIEEFETRAEREANGATPTDSADTPDEQAAPDEPADPLSEAKQRISELENALLRSQTDILRTQADIENLNRRSAKQISDAHKYAIERFSLEVLLLRDHLEMGAQSLEGLDANSKDATETIKKGFDMVLESFPGMLNRFDINEIECEGVEFDPNFHEAVGQVESGEVKPNHIASVRQKGYTISDRLLRPALVVVAK